MGDLERYEEMAARFHADTGVMAPGKDIAPAMGGGEHTDHSYRRGAWDAWLCMRDRQSDALANKMDALWSKHNDLLNDHQALKAKYDKLAAALEDIKGLTPEEYIGEGSDEKVDPIEVDPHGYGEAMRKMAAKALGVDDG